MRLRNLRARCCSFWYFNWVLGEEEEEEEDEVVVEEEEDDEDEEEEDDDEDNDKQAEGDPGSSIS